MQCPLFITKLRYDKVACRQWVYHLTEHPIKLYNYSLFKNELGIIDFNNSCTLPKESFMPGVSKPVSRTC